MPLDEQFSLSEREIEILRLVATGATNQEIARILIISPNTVKVHLRNIFEKLQVQSRTEATLVAIRSGLVAVENNAQAEENQSKELLQNEVSQLRAPLVPPRPNLQSDQTLPLWQQIYLAGAILIVVLAMLAPALRVAIAEQTRQSNWLTNVDTPQTNLPVREDASRWRVRANLPGPRARHAVAAFRGEIFSIGGETPTGVTDSVDAYVPARNVWQPRANLPRAVANVQAVVLKNLVYVPGGILSDGNASSAVQRFDPVANSWAEAPPLPEQRASYAMATDGERLFVIGGWNGQKIVDTTLVFDLRTNAWRETTRLPAPRVFSAAAFLEKNLYVVGGFDGKQATQTVFVGTISGQEIVWESAPSLKAARSGLALAVEEDALYAFGGGWNATLTFHERYDPATKTWSEIVSPWKSEWRHLGATTLGATVYVLGGWLGDYAEINEQYQAGFRTFLPSSPR